jgi:hypothetical protein
MVKLEDYFRRKVAPEGFDLFALFARFEYAMKKGGFCREGKAEAVWRAFAEKLPPRLFARLIAAPEVTIYFTNPPDQLISDGAGGVRWSGNPSKPTDLGSLFESIKVARNNLFHGDKAHDSHRDTALMKAALFVLNATYEEVEHRREFSGFVSALEFGL